MISAALIVFGLLGGVPSPAQEVEDCTEEALRAALADGGDFVMFEDCSITLSNALEITSEVFFIGTGTNSTLDGGGQSRIFEVHPGGRLEVSDMTITGGSNSLGGAIFVHEGAEAIFSNCVFTGNVALGRSGTNGFPGTDYSGIAGNGRPGGDATGGFGGAVYNLGTVTFLACQFVGNSATGGNGGVGGEGGEGGFSGGNGGRGGNGATGRGGAVFNLGMASLRDTLLESNTAEGGMGGLGGIGGEGPQTGIAGSGGYGARAAGAGIYNETAGTLDIVNCTFLLNNALGGDSAADGSINGGNQGGDGYNGGGAFGGGLCNMGNSGATNCTFVRNRAIGGAGANGGNGYFEAGDGGDGGEGYGGGIYNTGLQWLMNCTMATNGVVGGTNGVAGSGPSEGDNGSIGPRMGATIFGTSTGELHYQNSIFAYPTGSTNGVGRLFGWGNNISTDSSVPLGPGGLKKHPLLNPLGDYGGLTPTMSPKVGSPAIDAGEMEGAPEFDQRDFPRPAPEGGAPDIGAVEVQGPVIVEGPQSVTAGIGSTVTFSVETEGDPPLSYIWRRNGTNIPGATLSSYTISNVTSNSAGTYLVVVSNLVGRVESQPAVLTVIPAVAPVITVQPQSQAAPPGATVTFTIGATGSPPLYVQWRSNTVVIPRATNWTLVLQNIRTNYAADYSARVTNSAGAVVSDTARLTVAEGAPVITAQPQGSTVSPGANVTFTVAATGTPPLYVQWRSNNVSIPLATNWSFTLISVVTNSAADYSARITNAVGAVVSDIARLRVEPAPQVAATPVGGTNFVLAFPTTTGLTYVTEFKESLSSTNWTPLITNLGKGLVITNVDGMTNGPARFYRIRTQ